MRTIILSAKLLTLFLIILVSSCSKDFLNKNPNDQLNATTFFTSKTAIYAALTSCYATLQDPMFTTSNPYYDCMADDGYNFNRS